MLAFLPCCLAGCGSIPSPASCVAFPCTALHVWDCICVWLSCHALPIHHVLCTHACAARCHSHPCAFLTSHIACSICSCTQTSRWLPCAWWHACTPASSTHSFIHSSIDSFIHVFHPRRSCCCSRPTSRGVLSWRRAWPHSPSHSSPCSSRCSHATCWCAALWSMPSYLGMTVFAARSRTALSFQGSLWARRIIVISTI